MLFIGIQCFAQKYTLALNLKPDSTYYLSQDANLTIVETIDGQDQLISTLINGRLSHKVIAVRDSTYELEVRYQSIGMHMVIGERRIDFSSDNKNSQDVYTKIMMGMLDKPFTVIISRKGKVLEVKNIEKLYSDMLVNLPQITEAQKAQFKNQMEQSFGDKAIKGNFQDVFAMFPATVVGLNDTWESSTLLESVVTATTTTTYSLRQITDKNYLIHGDAVIKADGSAEFKQINGMPLRYINISGTAITDLKLDKATGWITEAKISKNIKGTIEIKDNPRIPGGMTFPMTVTGDMTVTGRQ